MARARNIKPSFFKNDELAELSMEARLCFIGLWTISDCFGRMELRPKRIKAELFPYDNVDIDEIIKNLNEYRFIRIYSVQGRRYLEIVNFVKHQNPHKNEKQKGSDIPAPPSEEAEAQESQGLEEKPDKIGTKPDEIGSARADSLNLIPDSLNLIPEEICASGEARPPDKQDPMSDQGNQKKSEPCRFDEFWAVYPINRDKKKARGIWQRKKLNHLADMLIDDVKNRTENDANWVNGYTPYATTYLNGDRWNDELKGRPESNKKQNSSGAGGSAIDQVMSGIEAADQRHHEQCLDNYDPAIRPPMGEQLRGGSGSQGGMGGVIEGDFSRHD